MDGVLWMTIDDQKKLIGRLRRVAGQVRALEQSIASEDPDSVANQLLAVIAASRACLRFYAEKQILIREDLSQSDRALLARLLEKTS